MPRRFTATEKHDDRWVRGLSHEGYRLWTYLLDSCDIAGFWTIDPETVEAKCHIPEADFPRVLQEIAKSWRRVDEETIWMVTFLYHQGNLPLNPNCQTGKGIESAIRRHNLFRPVLEKELEGLTLRKGLGNPSGNGIGNGKEEGCGEKPIFTLENIKDAGHVIGITDGQAETFFHHYAAQGWKLGNGLPIVDIGSALVKWRNNAYKFPEAPAPKKPRLCDCGCGKPIDMRWVAGSYKFAGKQCRIKKLGW